MPSADATPPQSPEPSAREIRQQLARIEEARCFRVSDRQLRLLSHLVNETIAGRKGMLSQRHLADDVFARGPEFDPEKDAIVRVEMRKLRQALTTYYAEDGASDPVIISIPNGSYVPRFSAMSPRPGTSPGFATPLRLAIAGFQNLSDQARDGWMAEGIHTELMTLLSRIPELQLVPPHEPASATDDRQRFLWLREQHQVRFALDGSTRLVGRGVRVNVFLYDLAADRQVWSGRYDRVVDPDSLLDICEDIARSVVAEAADLFTGFIGRSLQREAGMESNQQDPVYKAQILFHRYLQNTTDATYRDAHMAIQHARRLNPENPMLLAMDADLLRAGYALGFQDTDNPADHVLTLNQQALRLAPNCVPCRVSLCFTLLFRREINRLNEEIETILNDHTAPTSYHADTAVPLALSGQWERGCQILQQSMSGNVTHPHYFQYPFFLREYRSANYTQAAEIGRRQASLRSHERFWDIQVHQNRFDL
ncbi:MAG: hypothetical protein ABW095_08180 [Candidatus Thiodiazotropha sp.]